MFRGLREIKIESNAIAPECALFSHPRPSKQQLHLSQPKQNISTKSKKKIKCPPSKFMKHQKNLSQVHQKKAISPIPIQQNPIPSQPINFKETKTKRQQFNGLPPIYKPQQQIKASLTHRPIQYVFHSPRDMKDVKKYDSPQPQNKPSQPQTYPPTKRVSIQNLIYPSQSKCKLFPVSSKLKTLQQFDPKMAESVINSTIDEIRMQQSKIMINFFNHEVLQQSNNLPRSEGCIQLTDSDNSFGK